MDNQVSFFDPMQEREAKRKRQLAEILVTKGNQDFKNEQAGGMTVARSPLEFINQGAQKAYGEYQLQQADEQEAGIEKQRQKLMQDALNQYGQDPRGAAATLGQDPRNAEMAFKLMQGETEYDRKKERYGQEDALQRELADKRVAALSSSGGNTPAAMQIANEMFALEQIMHNPSIPEDQRFLARRRYNLLGQTVKTYGFDRGLQASSMDGYGAVYGQPQQIQINGAAGGGQMTVPMPDFGGMNIPPVQAPNGQMQMPQQATNPGMPQPPNGYPQDPVAAVQGQPQASQFVNVPPKSQVGMSEIPGFGKAIAGIAGQKKGAETKAAEREKLMAEAQANFGSVRDNYITGQNIVNRALNSPGLASNFGALGMIPNMPGGEASDAASILDQIEGGAFLTAFETLKGGGQITEVEGLKATNAIVRMKRAQSEAAFREALKDYMDVMDRGYQKAYEKASGKSFSDWDNQSTFPSATPPVSNQQAPTANTESVADEIARLKKELRLPN